MLSNFEQKYCRRCFKKGCPVETFFTLSISSVEERYLMFFSGILAERLPTLADPAVCSTFEYLV
jgi:hypothetical protein